MYKLVVYADMDFHSIIFCGLFKTKREIIEFSQGIIGYENKNKNKYKTKSCFYSVEKVKSYNM